MTPEQIAQELNELKSRAQKTENNQYRFDLRLERMEEKLDELLDDTKWLRRSITAALLTMTTAGLGSLIVWLIQR